MTREVKIADPRAVVTMEYDKLAVNGRKYSWNDAAHAVMDLQDNSVTDLKFCLQYLELYVIQDCVHPEMHQVQGILRLTDQGRAQVPVQIPIKSKRQTIKKSIKTGRQEWDEVCTFFTLLVIMTHFIYQDHPVSATHPLSVPVPPAPAG